MPSARHYRPGPWFGESMAPHALLQRIDATAEGDTRLLRLDRDSMFDIMVDYP